MGKTYRSMAWRRELKKRYHFLYQSIGRSGDPCWYCGLPGESEDHVPPLSVVADLGTDYLRKNGYSLYTLRCCTECNSVLGNRFLLTPEARSKALLSRYKKTYFDLIDRPKWTLSEIDELSGWLQKYVDESNMLREITVRRLACLRSRAGGDAPEED